MEIVRFFCRKTGIAPEILPTEDFLPPGEDASDYRYAIHPKRENAILEGFGAKREYWQVFREKFGFTPGLSVADLLFNEGPESICWL